MINVYRDPQSTMSAVATLCEQAFDDGYSPVQWHVGFFTLRDIIEARFPHFREIAADRVRQAAVLPKMPRPLVIYGGEIHVVVLGDFLQLLAGKGSLGKVYR